MTVIVILLILEAAAITVLWEKQRRLERVAEEKENQDAVSRERAAALEKAWNDGVSSILGYDMNMAKGAVNDER